MLEQIIITQLERRGLKLVGGAERNFRWHLLTQTASSATVSVDVLVDPFPDSLALPQASDYTAALRLVSLPGADRADGGAGLAGAGRGVSGQALP
jgi:hypothetical protein